MSPPARDAAGLQLVHANAVENQRGMGEEEETFRFSSPLPVLTLPFSSSCPAPQLFGRIAAIANVRD